MVPAPFTEEALSTATGKKCVLVASTEPARQQGLMGVHTTAPWDGMLFVFAAPNRTGFWMKDTLIPLDIAFIGASGAVQEVLAMEPCPPEVAQCPIYTPAREYSSALEVERGKATSFGLVPGSTVAPAGAC